MSTYSFLTAINGMAGSMQQNKKIIMEKSEVVQAAAPGNAVAAEWPAAVKQLYNEMNGAAIQWKPVGYEDKPYVCGKLNLLSAEQVAAGGKGLIWFDHTPADSLLRNFKLLDFFADEAATGFVEGANTSGEIYLYLFSGEPIPLNVDAEGYTKLLVEARGFFYWQQVLVAVQQAKDNQEQQDFITYMPELFSGFNYDIFINLYRSLRIRK